MSLFCFFSCVTFHLWVDWLIVETTSCSIKTHKTNRPLAIKGQFKPIDDYGSGLVVNQWHNHQRVEHRPGPTCRLCSFAPDLQSASVKAPSSSTREWLSASPFCSCRQWDTRSSASLLWACRRFRCCYKNPDRLKNKKRGTKEIHKINTFIHCIYIYIQILFGCAVYIGVFV